MNATLDFPPLPGLAADTVATPPGEPAGVQLHDAAAQPAVSGRRWSDGAGTHAPADPNAPWSMAQQWPHLVAALSEQAVESSNLLLRALNHLVGAGRLRSGEARALSDAMQQLRGTSLRAQQITRLAGGRIRQSRERVDLAELVDHVVADRADELAAAGITVHLDLCAVDVLLDPPVATGLVNSILDWSATFGRELQLTLVPSEWPGPARLEVRVLVPRAARADTPGAPARRRGRRLNDGLHWMLLRQMAAASALHVTRSRENGATRLTVDFPKTFISSEGVARLELTDGDSASTALRNTWVLVMARDDRLRADAVEALRRMGIDAVAATDPMHARVVLGTQRPDVLVAAYDIAPDEVERFRHDVLGGEERCPLVEITRDLPSFHLSGFDRFETPKVGRHQLTAELPPTVLFELVKLV